MTDLANAIAPECDLQFTGIRPGEKLHESMICEDDAPYTYDHGSHFTIQPAIRNWTVKNPDYLNKAKLVPTGFSYTSDRNEEWMKKEELLKLLKSYRHAGAELVYLDDALSNSPRPTQDTSAEGK